LKKFELHIDVINNDFSIINHISSACSLSHKEIKQAIDKGALWLTKGKSTQRLRRLKKPVKSGETLHFYYDEKVLSQSPTPAQLISDHTKYSIWYKSYGMLSQGSKWSDHCTIARWVEKSFDRPCFIVHRLDRAASGLIIIAHSKKVAAQFGQLFEKHDLKKHYQIISHGKWLNNTDDPLVVEQPIDEKRAKSTLQLSSYNEALDMSLIDVEIATGRKHQIRKHSASIGLPVVGDRLHGNASHHYTNAVNLQLCAVKLSFKCPIEQIINTVELPTSLRPRFETLLNIELYEQ